MCKDKINMFFILIFIQLYLSLLFGIIKKILKCSFFISFNKKDRTKCNKNAWVVMRTRGN